MESTDDDVSKSQYGRTSVTPPTLYVPPNRDPMARVYEKLVKIREREEKAKAMERPKVVEQPKRESSTPPQVIVIEDEKPSRFRKSILDIKNKYKIRHTWPTPQRSKDKEEKTFQLIKRELLRKSKSETEDLWYRMVGKYLEDDAIEKEWKILIGEAPVGDQMPLESKTKSLAARAKSPSDRIGLSILQVAKIREDKPLSRRELIELRKAQIRAMDMKFVDIYRKEPVKLAYNQTLIKRLRSRLPLGKEAHSVLDITKKKKQVKPKSKARDKRHVSICVPRLSSLSDDLEASEKKSGDDEVMKEAAEIPRVRKASERRPEDEMTPESGDLSWSSCESLSESEEGEKAKGKNLKVMAPLILEHSELDDESGTEGAHEDIWKYLEQLAPQDSDDSLEFLRFDEKRHKMASMPPEEGDIYMEFKKRQKEMEEKDKQETEIQEKLIRRLEKLEKLKDPLYWQKLMDESLIKIPDVENPDGNVLDEEFEHFISKLEEEDGEFFGDVEEEIQEEREEAEAVASGIPVVELQKDPSLICTEIKEEVQDEQLPEDDVKRLSDTKTNSTVSEHVVEEEEKEETSKEFTLPRISPKARYFDPNFPELYASDTSLNPSYTNLKRPYALVCAERIKSRIEGYKKLFRNELLSLQRRHTFAFSGVQLARQFIIGIRVPRRFPDPYNYRGRQRLERLLKE